MRACILFTIVLILALGFGLQAAQNPPSAAGSATTPPAGNAQTGKRLFETYGCYQCHGYEAQGGAAGPRLAPGPLAYAPFANYVRNPSGQMPPYTVKVVSNQQMNDIYAFLRSVPEPPSVDSIPILKNN
jgi:mono/diheme cytochrome c family protein